MSFIKITRLSKGGFFLYNLIVVMTFCSECAARRTRKIHSGDTVSPHRSPAAIFRKRLYPFHRPPPSPRSSAAMPQSLPISRRRYRTRRIFKYVPSAYSVNSFKESAIIFSPLSLFPLRPIPLFPECARQIRCPVPARCESQPFRHRWSQCA